MMQERSPLMNHNNYEAHIDLTSPHKLLIRIILLAELKPDVRHHSFPSNLRWLRQCLKTLSLDTQHILLLTNYLYTLTGNLDPL